MNCGVVVFPGSNCDHDVYHVLKHVLGEPTTFLWHGEPNLRGCELVILPGGFSYGDYLRPGAIAARSPIMDEVRRYAEAGGLVLGISNGFQILLEAGLLPGAMRCNQGLRLRCENTLLRVERNDLPFTRRYAKGQVVEMPMAHAGGNYFVDEASLDQVETAGQVVFRYVDIDGRVTDESNPTGSTDAIAGLCNEAGNILGLMPHPDRCAEEVLGHTDGLELFASVVGASVGLVGAF